MYRYLNGSYILFKANNKSVFIIRLFKLHAETKYRRSNMLDNLFILTNQSGCFIYSLNYFNCIKELFLDKMKHNLNISLWAVWIKIEEKLSIISNLTIVRQIYALELCKKSFTPCFHKKCLIAYFEWIEFL